MIKRLLCSLLFCLVAVPASAQVTFDVASKASGLSVSHTRGAGSNPYAQACVTTRNDALDITAVSYGGTPMIQIAETAAANQRAELWELINPPSGAQTVTATGGDNDNTIIVSTYFGAHQTTPTGTPATVNGSEGTGTTLDVNVSANGLASDCLGHATTEALNVGAGQTERAEQASADSNSAVSTQGGSGTVTMSYDWTTEHYFGYIAVAIEPAATSDAPVVGLAPVTF